MSIQKSKLQQIREDQLLTKSELARKAEISAQTLSRIEKGGNCRMEIKRKIVLALGFTVDECDKVF